MSYLLNITDLSVSVGEKGILDGVNLKVGKGETHVIMGPNGAGKSTLGNSTLWVILITVVTEGKIHFEG